MLTDLTVQTHSGLIEDLQLYYPVTTHICKCGPCPHFGVLATLSSRHERMVHVRVGSKTRNR